MKSQQFRTLILNFILSVALAAAFQVSNISHAKAAEAGSKHVRRSAHDAVRMSAAAPIVESHHYSSAGSASETRFGLGFTSAYNLTSATSALTGWIGLGPKFGIQPLVSIGSTSPFNFAVGALGKYTVHQSGSAGFHLGGGLSLGSVHKGSTSGAVLFGNTGATGAGTGFSLGLAALGGFHFAVPNTSNIMLHFDGGANFGVVDGDTDFNLGTVGALLGASIIYLF